MAKHDTAESITRRKAGWQGARDYHSGIVCNPVNYGARVESAWADWYRSGYDRALLADLNGAKYIRVVRWARRRYTRSDGSLVVPDARHYTDYGRVERAAWNKWMA